MHLPGRIGIALFFAWALPGASPHFAVIGPSADSWPKVLSSIGLLPGRDASVTVARPGTPAEPGWEAKVDSGDVLLLEGESPLAGSFGFRARSNTVRVECLTDVHAPGLPLVLESPLQLKVVSVPDKARVFSKDRWSETPVIAGMRLGKGAVLWVATNPGKDGYERFPYLLQALLDLGFEPPFQTQRTWAFFDSAYRARADVDYLAARWRKAGISALHVASWHFYEPDPVRDEYVRQLIEACHHEGILVYAWIEFPHVSEKFWNDHPEWRERTAVLQDAALDWRKLMNLENPRCFQAASAGLEAVFRRFDWDGANLAELYYESLEGAANPARFTPFNDDVRRSFQQEYGFDPHELWSTRTDAASLRSFLDYRANLAVKMQERWLGELERYRAFRPDLDVVLTHVDDRIDPGMRDAIGADSARVLPLLGKFNFTFLVEDPATVWNLGPQRYPEIARHYPATSKLAIDINVVDRYQDVYPTKQQTGLELLELLHIASGSFPRVALYMESSVALADIPLLPAAAAVVTRYEQQGTKLLVDSPYGFTTAWSGGASIDSTPTATATGSRLFVPAGPHTLEHSPSAGPALSNFNGNLHSAHYSNAGIDLAYESASRALAKFDCDVSELKLDGNPAGITKFGRTLVLPSGEHTATVACSAANSRK